MSDTYKAARRTRRKKSSSGANIDALAKYLNNPIATGVWRLRANWVEDNRLSNYIWESIEKELNKKESITIKGGKRLRKISVNDDLRARLNEVIFRSLSFPFYVSAFLAEQDGLLTENTSPINDVAETTSLIFEIIDIKTTRDVLGEAYEFFKENILTHNFNPVIFTNRITSHKLGSIMVLNSPRSDTNITMVSWEGQPLKVIERFLGDLGVIEEVSTMPIFSPEEELFEPYFDILELTYETVIKQAHLHQTIEKAIKHYNEENYIDCVSSIGLLGEDVLTQVFETLFREQLIKGLTLGQLLDEIQRRINSLYRHDEEKSPDLSVLYAKIKKGIDDEDNKTSIALETLRELIKIQTEINKQTLAKIEKSGKQEKTKTIFPTRVLNCINELIKYRNASSHKSRIPIGPYESKRSAYSFVVFFLWWEAEKHSIEWELSEEEIIRSIVTRNS